MDVTHSNEATAYPFLLLYFNGRNREVLGGGSYIIKIKLVKISDCHEIQCVDSVFHAESESDLGLAHLWLVTS